MEKTNEEVQRRVTSGGVVVNSPRTCVTPSASSVNLLFEICCYLL